MSESYKKDFEKAINRLEEVLKERKTMIIRDSAIKRFEICFDLSWKLIQKMARKQGMDCVSPRSCFRVGFELKFIDYDDQWLQMIEDRNTTSHLYKEEYADKVYQRLNEYLVLFKALSKK